MNVKKFKPLATFLNGLFVLYLSINIGVRGAQADSHQPDDLDSQVQLSSPEECARECRVGGPPKTCYYKWTLELYTVRGNACEICTPNNTNALQENCQCVLADGIERIFLSVNRMLPGPTINVCLGDQVIVDVINRMTSNEVTIHWHGVFQNGHQYYDGVPLLTQCPISTGNTFRYQWMANNAGTHFWHSHTNLQKFDGIYGKLTIREPQVNDFNGHLYDEDLIDHEIIISDWLHELATERFPGLLGAKLGQRPVSLLINGKGQYTDERTGSRTDTPIEAFNIKPGRRYRFRLINSLSSVCPAQFNIENHVMTVIAADGESVHPVDVNTIVSSSGERYDFIINANQTPGAYWIQLRGLRECAMRRVQQLAILRYEGAKNRRCFTRPTYDVGLPSGVILNPIDGICWLPREDAVCVSQLEHGRPVDKGILKPHPDVRLFLGYHFSNWTAKELFVPKTYKHYLVSPTKRLTASFINNISFVSPPSPPLSQLDDIPSSIFCNEGKRPSECGKAGECECMHRIDIPLNSIVEIILVDHDSNFDLAHPFHLHGYAFNVLGMGRSPDKDIDKITISHVRDLEKRGVLNRNMKMLPYKDTIVVPNNGYTILRFRANNPGEWLFHCHFSYHIPIGMEVVLHVGNRTDLPPVPKGFPKCGNFVPKINPIDEKKSEL